MSKILYKLTKKGKGKEEDYGTTEDLKKKKEKVRKPAKEVKASPVKTSKKVKSPKRKAPVPNGKDQPVAEDEVGLFVDESGRVREGSAGSFTDAALTHHSIEDTPYRGELRQSGDLEGEVQGMRRSVVEEEEELAKQFMREDVRGSLVEEGSVEELRSDAHNISLVEGFEEQVVNSKILKELYDEQVMDIQEPVTVPGVVCHDLSQPSGGDQEGGVYSAEENQQLSTVAEPPTAGSSTAQDPQQGETDGVDAGVTQHLQKKSLDTAGYEGDVEADYQEGKVGVESINYTCQDSVSASGGNRNDSVYEDAEIHFINRSTTEILNTAAEDTGIPEQSVKAADRDSSSVTDGENSSPTSHDTDEDFDSAQEDWDESEGVVGGTRVEAAALPVSYDLDSPISTSSMYQDALLSPTSSKSYDFPSPVETVNPDASLLGEDGRRSTSPHKLQRKISAVSVSSSDVFDEELDELLDEELDRLSEEEAEVPHSPAEGPDTTGHFPTLPEEAALQPQSHHSLAFPQPTTTDIFSHKAVTNASVPSESVPLESEEQSSTGQPSHSSEAVATSDVMTPSEDVPLECVSSSEVGAPVEGVVPPDGVASSECMSFSEGVTEIDTGQEKDAMASSTMVPPEEVLEQVKDSGYYSLPVSPKPSTASAVRDPPTTTTLVDDSFGDSEEEGMCTPPSEMVAPDVTQQETSDSFREATTSQPGCEEHPATPQPKCEEQPATSQPGGEEQPATSQPGGEEQPATQPRVEEQPATQPRVEEQPATQPRVEEQPATLQPGVEEQPTSPVPGSVSDAGNESSLTCSTEDKPDLPTAAPVVINTDEGKDKEASKDEMQKEVSTKEDAKVSTHMEKEVCTKEGEAVSTEEDKAVSTEDKEITSDLASKNSMKAKFPKLKIGAETAAAGREEGPASPYENSTPRRASRIRSPILSPDVMKHPGVDGTPCPPDRVGDQFLQHVVSSGHEAAEARLAQRRAARAEARELRLRELEKQQQDQENDETGQPATVTPSFTDGSGRVGAGRAAGRAGVNSGPGQFSRRSSEDSTTDESLPSNVREMRSELKELDEKFRKAMITNAQLDNEKATLTFEVELMKDRYADLEETHTQLTKEHRKKCLEYEQLRKVSTKLQEEVKILRGMVQERDQLIQEYGLVVVGEEEEEGEGAAGKEEDDEVMTLAPRNIFVKKALVSQEAAELLQKGAAQGSLDVRLRKFGEEKNDLEDQVRRLKLELEEERNKNRRRENGLDYEKQKEQSKTVNEYKFRVQKAEAEVSTLQANVTRLDALSVRYKTQSEELEKSEEELKLEKRKLQRELRDAQSRLEELETTNNHLIKRFDKLKNARSNLLKDLSQEPA